MSLCCWFRTARLAKRHIWTLEVRVTALLTYTPTTNHLLRIYCSQPCVINKCPLSLSKNDLSAAGRFAELRLLMPGELRVDIHDIPHHPSPSLTTPRRLSPPLIIPHHPSPPSIIPHHHPSSLILHLPLTTDRPRAPWPAAPRCAGRCRGWPWGWRRAADSTGLPAGVCGWGGVGMRLGEVG